MTGKGRGNPYLGILCYVVAPFFLATGIFFVLLGAWIRRRELARLAGLGEPAPLAIDLARKRDRTILGVFVSGTLVYLLMSAVGSYQTFVYTESPDLLRARVPFGHGARVHRLRPPAHAHVSCVDCHVGEGATRFISAKISGVRQLFGITFDSYPRPIPTPIHNLRPARETCERCHWPEKHSGNLERTIPASSRTRPTALTRCASSSRSGAAGRSSASRAASTGTRARTRRSSTSRRTFSARRSRGSG